MLRPKPRSFGLNAHQLALVFGALLPVLVFSAVMLVVFHRQTRAATERGLLETVHALSLAVDRELTGSISVLEALASDSELRRGDMKAFYEEAKAVLVARPSWASIVVFAPDGQQVMNTARPFGSKLPMATSADLVSQVARTGRPAVSDLLVGAVLQRPVLVVLVPVPGAPYVLGAATSPATVSAVLSQQTLPDGWICTLIDRKHRVVARSRDGERFVGQPAAPDLVARASAAPEGIFALRAMEGHAVYAAITRSPLTRWTIALGAPADAVDSALRSSLWLLAGLAAACGLLGVLAASLTARRIGQPMRALANAATALVHGQPLALPRSAVAEVDEVARAMEAASEGRREIEAANRLLLDEAERRRRVAEGHAEVARLVSQSLDVERIGQAVVEAAGRLIESRLARIYRLEVGSGDLVMIAQTGAETRQRQRLAAGTGAVGIAVRLGEPVATADVLADPRIEFSAEARAEMETLGFRAVLAVPLRVQERIVGALGFGREAGRSFSSDEVQIACTLAAQAAVALANAQLFAEREEVAAQLIDSEARFRMLFERNPLPMWVFSPETYRFLEVNNAAVAHYGYSREEFLAMSVFDIRPPEEIARLKEDLAGEPASPFRPGTWRHRLRDGRIIAVEVTAPPIEFAGRRARLVVAQDVTRSRRAEAAAAALSAVMAGLVADRDAVVTGRRIAESVQSLLGAQGATVCRIEPWTGDLVAVAATSPLWEGARLPAGTGLAGRAVELRRPVSSVDMLNDPDLVSTQEIRAVIAKTQMHAGVATPLVIGERIIGALVVGDTAGRVFSGEEVDLAQTFADQAAITLETARVYEETDRARRAAEEIARVAKTLTETLDEATIGARVVDSIVPLLAAQYCTLRLLEEDGSLRAVARGGPAAAQIDMPDVLAPGVGAPALVVRDGAPVMMADGLADPRMPVGSHHQRSVGSDARSILAVPLRVQGVIKGVLTIAGRVGRVFTEAEITLLQTLADQVAVALQNARSHAAVQHAYDELSSTHAQLTQAQKMEVIGRLAGGVAHDFNNLLTVIRGRSDLLLARLAKDDPGRSGVALISATAERAARLTHQLLAFSRKQVLDTRVIDLNVTVSGMEPLLRRLIGEDITVSARLEPALDQVKADPSQLEQVLLNLAVNARDAMPDGGQLTMETANAILDETYARRHPDVRPGAYVMLAVSDTGCGMPPEVLERVFEPFFTTKETGKGTGLGLATVYGVVKQSGGHISVYSEVGYGTTFKVYLPRIERASPQPGDDPAHPTPRGKETILLVEDEADVRTLAREILEIQGYRVLEADGPTAAMRITAAHDGPLHLVLTDVVMPGMNGRELATRLTDGRPDLQVLFMSGYTDDVIVRQGVLAPGTAFLSKPFGPAALARKVREVLDSRRAAGPALTAPGP